MQASLKRALVASKQVGTFSSRITASTPNVGARRLFSGKEIKFGVDGRAAILKGVDLLADAVQVCRYASKLGRNIAYFFLII